jgi:hypothetical protein
MGKRMIYGPDGEKVIVDDESEIPQGWGVDPELLKPKEIIKPKTVDYKQMTDKNELEEFGRSVGVEIDRRKSVPNIKREIKDGLQEKEAQG